MMKKLKKKPEAIALSEWLKRVGMTFEKLVESEHLSSENEVNAFCARMNILADSLIIKFFFREREKAAFSRMKSKISPPVIITSDFVEMASTDLKEIDGEDSSLSKKTRRKLRDRGPNDSTT